jgi:hypothetical protein
MTMTASNAPRLLLCTLRAFGGAAFLAPGLAARKLHVDDDPETAYLLRLFAARNTALVGGLLASRGETRRLWWQAGIACDALDVAAGVLAFRARKDPTHAIMDTSASLAATALGVAGLWGDRRTKRKRSR